MRSSDFYSGCFLLAAFLIVAVANCGKPPKPVPKIAPKPAAPVAKAVPVRKEPPQVEEKGWRRLGPGGGGSHFDCTVNPRDPKHVFSRCDMTGAQFSEDGGRTWRMFNLRTVVSDFEFDPTEPNTVYASNTGLYRSDNRGKTWRLIYPDPKNIVAEKMVGDHAEQWFVTRDNMPDGLIDKVRVDPQDSRHIYLGISPPMRTSDLTGPVQTGKMSKIMVSKDRGETWKKIADIPGHTVLALFPGSWQGKPGQVVAVTDLASIRINEDSKELKVLHLPVDSVKAADGGCVSGQTTFYILADMKQADFPEDSIIGGVYRSTDSGESWAQVNNGFLDDWPVTASLPYFKTFAACEHSPGVVYLSAHIYVDEIPWKPNRTKRERKFGIFKTENSGDTWRWVYKASEDTIYTNNMNGGWEDQSYGPEWGESPHSFGVSPSNPDICYVTDNRTYKTADGGKTWEQVYTDEHVNGAWSSRGIDVTTTYGVHFDPFNRSHIFITYTDIGLWHSFNSGRSWFHSLKGVPREWINTTYWLEFDPEVKGLIWSVRADCHDLPRPKMFRRGSLERFQGGVAVSKDGGMTWKPSNEGMPPNTVCTHILLDPASVSGSRTLYVCGFGRGVYKSSDNGQSWEIKNIGLGQNLFAWRMVRLPEGRLIVLVARGIRNGKVDNGALYFSDDGAESWKSMSMPKGVTAPNDLIYDPSEPKRMYLSSWPWTRNGVEVYGGLYRTEDSGKTWKLVFREDSHVYAAAIDPQNLSTIFINTFDSGAFWSEDRGETWQKIKGYSFKYGHRPVPDPFHPGMLYLTTFGGSVFYGPAKGDSAAVEDIENFSDNWRWQVARPVARKK